MPNAVPSSPLKVVDFDVNRTTQLEKPVMEDRSRADTKSVDAQNKLDYKMEIIWFNVIVLSMVHIMGFYGIYLSFTGGKLASVVFCYLYGSVGGVGITAGAHRLWSHRSYKAKLPLRILLMVMQTLSLQTSIYNWVRDHRVHHKYTETDADPHNSRRGFFFAHMGWLLIKKHPEVTRRGKGVDMSDIVNDPVVAFQMKHYWLLGPLLAFVIPTLIPVYFWGESLKIAFFITMKRYAMTLNFTWLVNSAAHMWGYKPYDKQMSPTENLGVSLLAYGEGWHNYHHVYPWDYKAAELGNYRANASTAFIDFFAWLGLAYDLKYATIDMVRKQAEKNGDGHWVQTIKSHHNDKNISSTNGKVF